MHRTEHKKLHCNKLYCTTLHKIFCKKNFNSNTIFAQELLQNESMCNNKNYNTQEKKYIKE